MAYDNIEALIDEHCEKFPHERLIFADEQAKRIAIKILCINIKFSGTHHNNDRPRFLENLS